MFARSRSGMFDSLGSHRPRRRVPGWLLWLVAGLLAGAAGVVLLQQRYLPPRLSAEESAALRQAHDRAQTQSQQLQAELALTQQRLQAALSDKVRSEDELAASRTQAERWRDDRAAVVQALPPDPRGGSVQVRSGQFSARDGTLDYLVVLMREGSARQPLSGLMQLTVAGESARGAPATVALTPIALTLGSHGVLRGSLQLPEGFKPRQTTVQVLDRAAGKSLGMRVLRIG